MSTYFLAKNTVTGKFFFGDFNEKQKILNYSPMFNRLNEEIYSASVNNTLYGSGAIEKIEMLNSDKFIFLIKQKEILTLNAILEKYPELYL